MGREGVRGRRVGVGRVGKGYSILFSAFFLSAFSLHWGAKVVGLEGLEVMVAWPGWGIGG